MCIRDSFQTDPVNVPILGLVENMSWFTPAELPDNKYYIFGRDGGKRLACLLYTSSVFSVALYHRLLRRVHYLLDFYSRELHYAS